LHSDPLSIRSNATGGRVPVGWNRFGDLFHYQELAAKTTTARELYDQMLVRYPEFPKRGALWSSLRALGKS
jgi:hypothetical protein